MIPHLFHVVPGPISAACLAKTLPPIATPCWKACADHIHWAGGLWTDSREGKGKHGEAGGGHAHVGAMMYLGDNWPDQYRDNVFTCNIHGKRINRDRLERRGSGYVARHDRDFLMANDPWFRGLELKYGPDGAVYMTDWYDTGECHENDSDGAHRENGRIYKITHGTPKPVTVDLASQDDEALAQLQLHHNDWFVRTARRLLQERAAAGRDLSKAHQLLRTILTENADVTRRLRAAWALFVSGGLDEKAALALLDQPSEHVRAWGVRLLCDAGSAGTGRGRAIRATGQNRPSPKVRLSLASALAAHSARSTMAVAEPLASHKEDASDAMLPLMIWYGVEPLVPVDQRRAVARRPTCEIPIVRRFVASAPSRQTPRPAWPPLSPCSSRQATRRVPIFSSAHTMHCRGRKHINRPDGWQDALAGLLTRSDLNVVEQGLLLPSISMIPRQPLYCGGLCETERPLLI